jgi:hypothetical protein
MLLINLVRFYKLIHVASSNSKSSQKLCLVKSQTHTPFAGFSLN